ncbi:ubiquitin carboxyl-terminal hydrolase, partial [Helicosporidium sp. ATCC 50920]
GLAGLGNLGNTCFMNSSLQCLAHAGPVMETFLSDAYERDLNRDNPLGLGGKLAEAFGGLMHKLWGPGASSVQPKHFKWQLSKFAPQFQGYAQQDSQELLAFLLDGLHEDLNRIREKPYVPEPDEDERESDAQRAERAWEGYRARNDSPIVDTFQGLYRSALECPDCRRTSVKFDPFMYLSLPLPAPKLRKLDVVLLDLSCAAQAAGRLEDRPQDGAADCGELRDGAVEGSPAARPSPAFSQAVHLAVE